MKTILTVGQGEIGAPLTRLIEQAGHKVYAKDILPLVVGEKIDAMLVSIPFKDKASFCQIVSDYINLYSPSLVIINSTTLPGTCEVLKNLHNDTIFTHSPTMGRHRKDAPEMMFEDIRAYPKFVGATTNEAFLLTEELFNSIGLKCIRMSSPTTSELAKLLETTYSGILIGWAQESESICNLYGVSRQETLLMIEAANQRIEFKRPTTVFPGFIGGHCIMPNIELLLQEIDSDYLEAVKKSNERKANENKES